LNAALVRILAAAQEFFAPDFCTIAAINPITGSFILPLVFRGPVRDLDRFRNASRSQLSIRRWEAF
jgi:hypothetical protein